ncbi:ATP-binding cassette domain-containing protein [Sphingomonas sp.]|uniref:ABC transporter ATP-binding protein n=1 Tax=Sphingomonas sp. TaxID=28214 RepID=UPI00307E3A66
MLRSWLDAYAILSPRKQRQAWLMLGILVIASLLEVAGVISIMPFLLVLESPALVESNRVVATVFHQGGFGSYHALLTALGITSFVLLLLAALVRLVALYGLNSYIHGCRLDISCRLFEAYLRQPYGFFLARHSGDMSTMVLSEVDAFVDNALMPMAQIVSSAFVLAILVVLLVAIDPLTAIVASLVISIVYLSIYRVSRTRIARSGADRMEANGKRFEVASEAFGGIKSIKVMGLEPVYLTRFRLPSLVAARSIILNTTLSQIPRIVVEATAFGFIILLALTLTLRRQDPNDAVLPLLGLYAFAGYRMLPAVQAIYQNFNNMRFGEAVIAKLYADMRLCRVDAHDAEAVPAPLLKHDLTLEALSYAYPDHGGLAGQRAGIRDIDLTLPAGQSLGIIGTTGAGKTTLVDVILGLLVHDTGRILVDGTAITDANRRAWQRRIGYVPQDIYLSASSVAENIAFGVDPDQIDHRRVVDVARMAHIDAFITAHLPQGYATAVGERGITLSGGQRQRIGIARALYHDPDLLVFDEATSALDNDTEAVVMDALNDLAGKKTIIIIAHRLTTIARCNQVIRLEQGRVVGRTVAGRDVACVEAV